MTTRGMVESDMEVVAGLIHRAVQVATEAQKTSGTKLVDFLTALDSPFFSSQLESLGTEVEELATAFPLPGLEP